MICKNCNTEYDDVYERCPVCQTPNDIKKEKSEKLLPSWMYVFAVTSIVIVVSYVFCLTMGLINFKDIDDYIVEQENSEIYNSVENTETRVFMNTEDWTYEEDITETYNTETQNTGTTAPVPTTEERTETTTETTTKQTTTKETTTRQTTTKPTTTKESTTKRTTTKPTTTRPATSSENNEGSGNLAPVQKTTRVSKDGE